MSAREGLHVAAAPAPLPDDLGRFDAALWELAGSGESVGTLASAVDAIGLASKEQITVETVIVDGAPPLDAVRSAKVPVEVRRNGLVDVAIIPDDVNVRIIWLTMFSLFGATPDGGHRPARSDCGL